MVIVKGYGKFTTNFIIKNLQIDLVTPIEQQWLMSLERKSPILKYVIISKDINIVNLKQVRVNLSLEFGKCIASRSDLGRLK